MNRKEMTAKICQALDEKKGGQITVLYVGDISVLADYFVIVSAGSVSQMQALAGNVEEKMLQAGVHSQAIEGRQGNHWILMDYGDVIVNVFHYEERRFYDLERIWRDAPDVTAEFLKAE